MITFFLIVVGLIVAPLVIQGLVFVVGLLLIIYTIITESIEMFIWRTKKRFKK